METEKLWKERQHFCAIAITYAGRDLNTVNLAQQGYVEKIAFWLYLSDFLPQLSE